MGSGTNKLTICRSSHNRSHIGAMRSTIMYIIMTGYQIAGPDNLAILVQRAENGKRVEAFPAAIQHRNQHAITIKAQFM